MSSGRDTIAVQPMRYRDENGQRWATLRGRPRAPDLMSEIDSRPPSE
jgi:hypothetical protein